MGAGAWQTLARLKEHWGTSIQALLYRARRLGVLSELLGQAGIGEARLIEQCRVPADLFHTVTSCVPRYALPPADPVAVHDSRCVVSLFQ
jgi:hypothetical protein